MTNRILRFIESDKTQIGCLLIIIAFVLFYFTCREQPPPLKAVLYKGYAISILFDDRVEALRTTDWRLDKKFSSALQKYNPRFLYADSNYLAMVNKESAYIWSDDEFRWQKTADLPWRSIYVHDIVLLNDHFVVIYPREIIDLSSGRSYKIPIRHGFAWPIRSRLQAVHAGKDKLWFGTGKGEWGGCLLSLDIEKDKWQRVCSQLLYVNSLTGDKVGNAWVAWAMNHFDAYTAVTTTNCVKEIRCKGEFWRDHYLQVIAYNKFDDGLYGIDENILVRIDGERFVQLADLGKLRYKNNPYAIGVLPNIDNLLIVRKDTFLIPHKRDGLFLYEKGNVRKLEKSKSNAYWLYLRLRWVIKFYKIGKYKIKRWTEEFSDFLREMKIVIK
jgi:hypothetical protein